MMTQNEISNIVEEDIKTEYRNGECQGFYPSNDYEVERTAEIYGQNYSESDLPAYYRNEKNEQLAKDYEAQYRYEITEKQTDELAEFQASVNKLGKILGRIK
uniref:Uncharacterized protein n=1 Tax=viral metagenome TaxID=1070528 RepID=A0A6M3LD79_9ZZZZ